MKRPFPAILHMLHDVAECLDVVHSAPKVHRDVKYAHGLCLSIPQCVQTRSRCFVCQVPSRHSYFRGMD